MQATCKSDLINVFFLDSLYLEKGTVALVVVLFDLGIAFIMYTSFLYLRAMQNITAVEVNDQDVTASDFAVQIKNVPEHANLKDLKC